MIPEKSGITVESTVQGESIKMRLDEHAIAHLASVLTNLYADRALAAIREPSTNARDALLAAANGDLPIEVDLPTTLRPILSIRDRGTGMSADDIREVYSAYGASTKRDTDDFNGMLGLGCKAPLAYTDQFVVTSVQDGQRIVVSVARDGEGIGAMTILQSGETDEPNGTQIDIPTRSGDADTIAAKAREFFSYWEEGTVLLNGEEPDRVEGAEVGDQFLIVPERSGVYINRRQDWMRMHVIMGGVKYPLPDGYEHAALKALPNGYSLLAFVPIGTVMFTPSREGLQDTPQTIAALDQVMAEYAAQLSKLLEDTVTNAESPWSAAKAITDAKRKYGFVPPMKYQGRLIPDKVEFTDGARVWRGGRGGFHGFTLEKASYLSTVNLADALASDVIWITKFTNKAWTQPMRRKFNAYLEQELEMEDASNHYVLITDAAEVPARDWLGDATVIPWEDIKKWKDPSKPRNAPGATKYAGTYPTIPAPPKDDPEATMYWTETYPAAELQASDAPIYYYPHMKHRGGLTREAQQLLGRCHLVFVPTHRLDKFLRLFPDAKQAREAVAAKLEADWKRVSSTNRGAILHGRTLQNDHPVLLHIDADALHDKALARLVRLAQHKVPEETRLKWHKWWAFMPMSLQNCGGEIDTSALDKYALINHIDTPYRGRLDADHLTMYLNAAYAAETEA